MSDLKYSSVSRSKGVYAYRLDGKQADEEFQYYFHVPGGKSLSVTVNTDHDIDYKNMEPIEVARELQQIRSKYWLGKMTEEFELLIRQLSSREKEDFINRRIVRIDRLKRELSQLEGEIEDYHPHPTEEAR